MKSNIFWLVVLLFPISVSWAANPALVPNSQKPDETIVDNYVSSKHTMDTNGLEYEIIVRGGKPGIVTKITELLKKGTPQEQSKAQYLVHLIPEGFVPYALNILKTQKDDFSSVQFAAGILRDAGDPKTIPALQALDQDVLKDKYPDKDHALKAMVLSALVACKDKQSFPQLEKEAETMTGNKQIGFYGSLAAAGDIPAKSALRKIFSGALTPYNVIWAMEILYTIGDTADFPLIQNLIIQDQKNPHNPYTGDIYVEEDAFISTTFPLSGDQKAKAVAKFFTAKHEYVKVMAIQELGRMGTHEALELLKTCLNNQWLNLRMETIKALRKNGKTITCKPNGWDEILKAE